MRRAGALAAIALLAGCANAGEDRILSIAATGGVSGVVYFDANGTGQQEMAPFGPDTGLTGIAVHLLVRGTRDTVASATTGAGGAFSMTALPVGSYVVVLDRTAIGDTVAVLGADTSTVTVTPDSTSAFTVGVGYPRLTIAQARSHPIGRRVVVVGVALNTRTVFRDTTVHLQDTSGAVRLARVRTLGVFAGDSIRVRATTGNPALRAGQPFLDDVTVIFPFTVLGFPTSVRLMTAAAAAAGSSLDAQLVVIDSALIGDTSTVTGDRRLTVDDGSGPLEVLLDGTWFTPPSPAQEVYVPGNSFAFVGVLVPTGTGVWRLKPRSSQDLTQR